MYHFRDTGAPSRKKNLLLNQMEKSKSRPTVSIWGRFSCKYPVYPKDTVGRLLDFSIWLRSKFFYGWGPLYLGTGTCWKEAVFIFGISEVNLVKTGYLHENLPQLDTVGRFLDFSIWLRSKFFTAGGLCISETVSARKKRSSFLESACSI